MAGAGFEGEDPGLDTAATVMESTEMLPIPTAAPMERTVQSSLPVALLSCLCSSSVLYSQDVLYPVDSCML